MLVVFQIVVFLYSVVLHEVSHGFVAYSMGDDTAKNMGRLTLNPIKHLDMFGSVLLPLFLILISHGQFAFGYAKPVPYNPLNLRDKKYGPAKVAFAGPATNLVLALLFGFVYRLLPTSFGVVLPELFSYIIWVNLLLAVFNLIPIPPLDGHWLLFSIPLTKLNGLKNFIAKNSQILFILFLFLVLSGILPLGDLINFLIRVIVGS
jgi:Zn-dependent protease